MHADDRMGLENLGFARERSLLKRNISEGYEKMQRNREEYIVMCDQCDNYQARIIETLNDTKIAGEEPHRNQPESPTVFEYKIDKRIIEIIRTQDEKTRRKKLGLSTPKTPQPKKKETKEIYIAWHKQKNKAKLLKFSQKIFKKLADRDPSKIEQERIKNMVGRNEKNKPSEGRKSHKKKKSKGNEEKKKSRSSSKQSRRKSDALIDDKLAKRISKLETAMSNAVIDGEATTVKKKKKKKQKTRDGADGEAREKAERVQSDDHTKIEKDGGKVLEEKKLKNKKDKKKKKKKKKTKWDDVDLKKILKKEEELKEKLKS